MLQHSFSVEVALRYGLAEAIVLQCLSRWLKERTTDSDYVLADMLLDKKAAIKASNFLSAEDFYRESHKLIFAAMQELVDKNIPIDYISMIDALQTKNQLEAIGGLAYLMSLNRASPTAANLEQHMKIIKKEAIKRQLLRFAREVMAGTVSGDDVAVQLDTALQSLSVASLRSRARRLQLDQGLDVLFIDYIQLMSGASKNQDRQQAIAEISRSLKALDRELNIPIVALSQLSRAVEGRQTKRPLMSDLRESGSLEQDADLIMFLYRDDYYFSNSREPGVTEMIIAKHRNGPVGNFKFYFEKQHTRFIELL